MEDRKYLTQRGWQKLQQELRHLKETKRPELAKKLAKAISLGDLSENSEYHALKETQAFVEGRIRGLEALLAGARVVKTRDNRRVGLGSTVWVLLGGNEERLTIVGEEESDPLQGKISLKSPVGQALLGRREGEEFKIVASQKKMTCKVLRIEVSDYSL